jgi:hypothetical protein
MLTSLVRQAIIQIVNDNALTEVYTFDAKTGTSRHLLYCPADMSAITIKYHTPQNVAEDITVYLMLGKMDGGVFDHSDSVRLWMDNPSTLKQLHDKLREWVETHITVIGTDARTDLPEASD